MNLTLSVAAVWTKDVMRAHRVADKLDVSDKIIV